MVAVITPPGEGGIAALRIAGKRSLRFLNRFFRPISPGPDKPKPFVLRYGHFLCREGEVVDEVMAVYMPQGKSYTGQDQVEIYCHGGGHVVKLIQNEIVSGGARVAEPGEFTKLAFLAGRIDLTKAEAVAEVIEANTDKSFEAAREHLLGSYFEHVSQLRNSAVDIIAEVEASVDYPEEDIDPADQARLKGQLDGLIDDIKKLTETYRGGRIVREGFRIAISGRPNAGKSSLFNLLLRQERALVTPTPGTTRDYLSEWIDLGGYRVNIVDTAGLRTAGGDIEKAGQKSALKILESSQLVLWMIDISARNWRATLAKDIKRLPTNTIMLLGNKIDLTSKGSAAAPIVAGDDIWPISCLRSTGIRPLKAAIIEKIQDNLPDLTDGIMVTSARHQQKLKAAMRNLRSARRKIKTGETPELTAFDLRQAIGAIDEITGKIYSEEILGRIFSKFCIGK